MEPLYHCRTQSTSPSVLVRESYCGPSQAFDHAIAAFAEVYADQNERDYKALSDAVKSGRIIAQTGL